MSSLRALYDRLNKPPFKDYVSYIDGNLVYPVFENGEIIELTPKELLEVGCTNPSIQHVRIAYFGDISTRVMYFGEDSKKMLETLQLLKVPRISSNLGETFFKIFRQSLEKHAVENKPSSMELKVSEEYIGKEHQFKLVLQKLLHVFSGNSIDEKFYAAL